MSETNVKTVTFSLFLVTFMSAVEGTIVTTAMPTIIGELKGMSIMNWVMSIYLLTSAITAPIYGKLADRFSRKLAFNIGISFFMAGSLLSGLSNNMVFLIASRAIQGLGGGAMLPLSLILIADLFDLNMRTKMMGLNSAIWGVAGLIGPLFGGIIVENFSWHWIFLINLPFGFLAMALISKGLHEHKVDHENLPLDIKGALFFSLIVLSFMLEIQFVGDGGIGIISIVMIVIFIFSLLFFIKVEHHAMDPIVSLSMLKNKNFMVYNSISFLMNGFLVALDVYIPMWVQVISGYSPTVSGVISAPESFLWMFGSFLASAVIARLGLRSTLIYGSFLSLILALFLAFLPKSMPLIGFIVFGSIVGIIFGVIFATFTVAVQQSVPEEEVGIATGLNSLVRVGGNTVMIAIYGVVLNTYLRLNMKQGMTLKMFNQLMDVNRRDQLPKKILIPMRNLMHHGLLAVFWTIVTIMVINLAVLIIFKTPQKFEND